VTLGVGASFDTQKLDQATHKVRLTVRKTMRDDDYDADTSKNRSAPASPSSRKRDVAPPFCAIGLGVVVA
jgi:hypothetical protein